MTITVVVPERDGGSVDEIATALESCQSAVSECQSYSALLESVDTQNAIELTTRISTEELTRATADTSLTTRLSTEEAARGSADTSINTRVSTETVTRTSADTSLTTRLSTEEVTRGSADTSLAVSIAGKEPISAVASEISFTSATVTEARGDGLTITTEFEVAGTVLTTYGAPISKAIRTTFNADGSISEVEV